MTMRTWAAAVRTLLVTVSLLLTLAGAPLAAAASPDPTSATAGDPRSSGQGPGLVGDPGMAVLLVFGIAAASVLVTVAYLRFTTPRGASRS